MRRVLRSHRHESHIDMKDTYSHVSHIDIKGMQRVKQLLEIILTKCSLWNQNLIWENVELYIYRIFNKWHLLRITFFSDDILQKAFVGKCNECCLWHKESHYWHWYSSLWRHRQSLFALNSTVSNWVDILWGFDVWEKWFLSLTLVGLNSQY